MDRYIKKNTNSKRTFVPFVFVATVITFIIGFYKIITKTGASYEGFNIYQLAGIFAVVILFQALTEKGFNPGNYLFYCIIVLMVAIFIENFLNFLIISGKENSLIMLTIFIGSIIIGCISNFLYIYTIDKGLRALEEKADNNIKK
ncbi:hypothetical protein [Fusobacterium sp. PH5-44]|uniref:hypothetical protein n=1 Tax=unclassified Fusobacterium TaxID=2648384 RepID=UPI003D2393C6